MSSVKSWMVGLAAGAVACGSVAHAAPVLVVDKQSQEVQTPAAPATGFSYAQTSPLESKLTVYTEGFLFCGNPGDGTTTAAELKVTHEDQTLTPRGVWQFASATDVPALIYTGGTLSLNSNQETSLACLGTAVNGALASGVREGIFDNGYDSLTKTNYSHLVNWIPQNAFDWNAPDWAEVPVDPCSSTANEPAQVVEDVACAAVTGVRPTADGARRAGTVWTATDGTNFTYVVRFDARFGAQEPNGAVQMQIPDGGDSINAGTDASITIRDAFDGTYLDSTGGGQYCLLTELPTTLNSAVCAGASPTALNGKPLDKSYSVGLPPGGTPVRSFYVAVTRPIVGGHASATTPVVAFATLVEGAVVHEGGDKFSGDNIAFGFQPSAGAGFSWMKEQ